MHLKSWPGFYFISFDLELFQESDQLGGVIFFSKKASLRKFLYTIMAQKRSVEYYLLYSNFPRTNRQIGFRSLTRVWRNPMIGSRGLNCGESF